MFNASDNSEHTHKWHFLSCSESNLLWGVRLDGVLSWMQCWPVLLAHVGGILWPGRSGARGGQLEARKQTCLEITSWDLFLIILSTSGLTGDTGGATVTGLERPPREATWCILLLTPWHCLDWANVPMTYHCQPRSRPTTRTGDCRPSPGRQSEQPATCS